MALKTKAGITRKPKIVKHQKSGYSTVKIVQYLMACITRKLKIAKHQKLGYLSAKIVQYLTLKTKAGKQGRGRQRSIRNHLLARNTEAGKTRKVEDSGESEIRLYFHGESETRLFIR